MNPTNYPDQIKVVGKNRHITGHIRLAGSKSISNRVLIIQALTKDPFEIDGLAASQDTQTLRALLQSEQSWLDTGAAGTTYRFLTAYLCTTGFSGVLTGSERMQQRPIGPLVDALQKLGAKISYENKPGYPPLRYEPSLLDRSKFVELSASVSSQYISALLLIAPTLPHGLTIHLQGKIVSKPYLMMTLRLMEYFGVQHEWLGQSIHIPPQAYQARDIVIEADWSAASYFYSLAALSETCDLTLTGLFADSLQGDSAIVDIMSTLGVETTFNTNQARLTKKSKNISKGPFEYDFIACPDLAQTVFATCAGLGQQGIFTGLETLYIKETDRVVAMQQELEKVGVCIGRMSGSIEGPHEVRGSIQKPKETPVFETYEDHRMAMALAPLAVFFPVKFNHPGVVVKSYPDFWKDWQSLGFEIIPG